jgi:hypothetical protein
MRRNFTIFFIFIVFILQGCRLFCIDYCWCENEFGRRQLNPRYIKLDKSFDAVSAEIIRKDAVYFYQSEAEHIDMKVYILIRFFKNGQYALYSFNEKPIQSNDYTLLEYNDLRKSRYAGYYNISDSIITLEKPNHLSRRAGIRLLDKYQILSNGNLECITRAASDYGAVYELITDPRIAVLPVEPDW